MAGPYRVNTTPDLILLAVQTSIVSTLQNYTTTMCPITINPDLLLLVPKVPSYCTIYENGIRIVNEETIDYTTAQDSPLTNYPDCVMEIWVTLWLFLGSNTAQTMNFQLNGSQTNALYPLEQGIMEAVNLFDPYNTDGNLILSAPIRFEPPKEHTIQSPTTTSNSNFGPNLTAGTMWSKTRFKFMARFIWNLDYAPVPSGGGYSDGYSSGYNVD